MSSGPDTISIANVWPCVCAGLASGPQAACVLWWSSSASLSAVPLQCDSPSVGDGLHVVVPFCRLVDICCFCVCVCDVPAKEVCVCVVGSVSRLPSFAENLMALTLILPFVVF